MDSTLQSIAANGSMPPVSLVLAPTSLLNGESSKHGLGNIMVLNSNTKHSMGESHRIISANAGVDSKGLIPVTSPPNTLSP
ncbi:hypothetical protein SLA2020_002160 [Shorea laevis]